MSVHNFTDEVADILERAANETKLQPSAQSIEVTRQGKAIIVTQKMADGKIYTHVVKVRRVKS